MRLATSRSGAWRFPSSGFPYWLFQALTTQNGAILANQDGTKVAYNDPKVVEAAQFFADLGQKYDVMPKGIIDWGTTPKDFFEGKTAIMWTTTGNLTNVRKNAKFAFGVAPMPSKMRGGSPTGGGNIYIFKNKDKAKVRRPRSNSPASSPRRTRRRTGALPPAISRRGPTPGRPTR